MSFADGTALSDSEVWTDGGRIAYVGPRKAEMPAFEREINLNGDLLMTGFKNAHAHSGMTFCRSLADDLPLDKWLSEKVWPYEAKLGREGMYVMVRLAILEYLSSGITSASEMYFHNDAIYKASVDSGFRTVINSALNNFDRDPTLIEREYAEYNGKSELITYRLALHAEYTTGLERMEYLASLAHKFKEPVFAHSSETKGEVEGCIERWGMTPTVLFEKLGFYDFGGGGYHCVYMSDEDIEIYKRRGLYAVLNPASNLKLASGIAPVTRFLREGIKLGIGTDGAGSNNALDMFREMYLVSALAKVREMDATACDAAEVLKMACVGSAGAMGLSDCDAIAEGKCADLIVLDMHRPNMRPLNNAAKNIVYAGSKENVRLTMVNGRILYENREFHVGEDAESIYAEAERIMELIKK